MWTLSAQWKALGRDDSGFLVDRHQPVGSDLRESLAPAIRPPDFEIDHRCIAQAEIQTPIVDRKVARLRQHLLRLHAAAVPGGDPRPIALRLDFTPMSRT